MTNTYKVIALLTLFAAIAGTGAFRQYPPADPGIRLRITDMSGAPLESFFAEVPPNASIAVAIKNGPSPMGACSSGITGAIEKIGRLFDIAAPVHAQGSCCPGGSASAWVAAVMSTRILVVLVVTAEFIGTLITIPRCSASE